MLMKKYPITHISEPNKFCLAKQVLIFWGIKMGNFCQQVLKSLGSYMRVFTVLDPTAPGHDFPFLLMGTMDANMFVSTRLRIWTTIGAKIPSKTEFVVG